MSFEKSGFNITVTCTQDATIVFQCRAKKRPGMKLSGKIDVTTDQSTVSKKFEPGDLLEITDGQLTVPDDPALEAKILAVIGDKGTITFTGKENNGTVAYANAWFASYTPDETGLDSKIPTAIITFQSSGTVPTVS